MIYPTRCLIAALITMGMSSAYLLDGPSEIEASKAVAADVADAIKTAQVSK